MADQKDKIILPTKYYLTYFNFLLDFVQSKSGHLLGPDEISFIQGFEQLSEDAQCLLIRMSNRKGIFFRLDKLLYEEIENIPQALTELTTSHFTLVNQTPSPDTFSLFTKAELDTLFPQRGYAKWDKDSVLLDLAVAQSADYEVIYNQYEIIELRADTEISFLRFLFFGNLHGMMTEFVIRDVGNIKLENLADHSFKSWFKTRDEALAVYELQQWDRALKQAMPLLPPEDIIQILEPVNWAALLQHQAAKKYGDKLMLRLGAYFEKSDKPEVAIRFYTYTKKYPSRERQVRLLEKISEPKLAYDLANEAFENSVNASEKIFMKDYLQKSGRRNYRSTTLRQKLGKQIHVTKNNDEKVENLALAFFNEQGYDGVHAENYLWRSMFGLMFWEELYDPENALFHHPLQRLPSDLYDAYFFENRRDQLETKLASLKSRTQFIKVLQQVFTNKTGINNFLVSWHPDTMKAIEACVKRVPLKGLKMVLLEMAKNIRDNSTGFPDLFLWNEQDYEFYEVKSPNDQLSSQQLYWIDFFQEHKIKTEILLVKYL